MDKNEYAWSFEISSMHYDGKYETIEECLEEARKCNYKNKKVVYIGVVADWDSSIDTDQVIENIQSTAYDYAPDLAEDYLNGIPEEQLKELDKELNEVFQKWKDKYKWNPTFFLLEEIKKYNLETGEFLAYVE